MKRTLSPLALGWISAFFTPAMNKEYFAPAKTLRSPEEKERLITAAKEKRERKAAKRRVVVEGGQ